jgi:hypothetical protein
MTLSSITFILSLLGIIGMLEYQAWHLRTNQIEIDEKMLRPMLINEPTMRRVGKKVLIKTRNGIHTTLITFTKYRILTGRAISKFTEEKFPRFYALFSTKHAIQAAQESKSSQVSFFWRSVAEYKYKIRNLKTEIRQEEKERAIEKINKESEEVEN